MNTTSKSKVSIIGTRGYPSFYGGFETLIRRIVPYLAAANWRVLVYGRTKRGQQHEATIGGDVVVRFTPGLDTRSLSAVSFGLTASLDAFFRKPDVALVMNVANGFWLPILRLRGIKTVVNVDGIEWERGKWGRIARAVFRSGAWLTARFATELVFDAEAIKDYWERRYDRSGTVIAYGGTRPPNLPVESGLTHRGYVLYVARFVPENTFSEFLGAAERLASRFPVVVVGSSGYGGDLEARLARLAAEEPRVTWLGHVSDDVRLDALWQHAGVYFHGHSVGGTNPALVQAMACGAPTVARDTVYNREVLGEAGLFTDPSSDAIYESIARLMGDPEQQQRLSLLSADRAAMRYAWDGICAAYDKTMRTVLRKG